MKICECIFFPQILLKDAQMQFIQTNGRYSLYSTVRTLKFHLWIFAFVNFMFIAVKASELVSCVKYS